MKIVGFGFGARTAPVAYFATLVRTSDYVILYTPMRDLRLLIGLFTCVIGLLVRPAAAQPAAGPAALQRHEFVIHDFHTESGVVLPEAHVVYSTLGTLNAAGDNAILLPSHYMATFNGYNWLIGTQGPAPERALNPGRDYLVLTELF